MKTSLTLSTVVIALTLSSAAFANGAQEQTQERTVATSATACTDTRADAEAATRAALDQLDSEVRQSVLGSLRASVVGALQIVSPVLAETTKQSLDLTAR